MKRGRNFSSLFGVNPALRAIHIGRKRKFSFIWIISSILKMTKNWLRRRYRLRLRTNVS